MKNAPLIRNGFSKGMMPSVDPSVVPPDALWTGLNVRANNSGVMRVRTGASAVGGTHGNGELQALEEGFDMILRVKDGNIYGMESDGTESTVETAVLPSDGTDYDYIRWSSNSKEIGYWYTGQGVYQTEDTGTKLVKPYVPASGEQINLMQLENLATDGECEDASKWTPTGSSLSLDNSVFNSGTGSLKAISSGANAAGTVKGNSTITVDPTKNYIVAIDVKNTSFVSVTFRVVRLGTGTTIKSDVAYSTTSWGTQYVTLGPADLGSDTGIKVEFGTNASASAQIFNYDALRVYPIETAEKTKIDAMTSAAARSYINDRYNMAAQNLDSGPARCKLAVLRASIGQRVALSGDPKSPNTVYLTAPLNGRYVPLNQVLQLPDDGAKIVALTNWYNALIIWRDRDIWAFFGSDVTDAAAALVLQDSSTGCVRGQTIAAIPGAGIWFYGTDNNVYMIQGVSGIENQVKATPVGTDVQEQIRKAAKGGLLRVSAIYYNQEYRLFFPESVEKYRLFCMKFGQGAGWYMDSGPRVSRVIEFGGDLYGAKFTGNQLIRFDDSLIDDDETYLPELLFRREDLQPGPSRIKKFFLYLISKGTSQNAPLFFMSDSFNEKPFGQGESVSTNLTTGTEQNLRVSLVCDGQETIIEDLTFVGEKVDFLDLEKSEPVRIYEAKFKYHPNANFVQVRIYGTVPRDDIAIIGYGFEYSVRGRIHAVQKRGD